MIRSERHRPYGSRRLTGAVIAALRYLFLRMFPKSEGNYWHDSSLDAQEAETVNNVPDSPQLPQPSSEFAPLVRLVSRPREA